MSPTGNRNYSDPTFGSVKDLVLANVADGAIGSANAARAILNRRTMLKNVTIKDFNLQVLVGATCTSTGTSADTVVATETYILGLGKSLAGTGAIVAMGTAQIGTAGVADDTVLDGSLTETDLDEGDDLVFFAEIGTALGDNSLIARMDVSMVERYV